VHREIAATQDPEIRSVTRIKSLAVAARERGWGRPGQPMATCRQIVAKLRSIDSTHARATHAADSTRRLQERASRTGSLGLLRSAPTPASSSPLRKPRIARPVGTHAAAPPYDSATVKYHGFEYDISRGALRHFNEASYPLVSRPRGRSTTTWSACKTTVEVAGPVAPAPARSAREQPQPRRRAGSRKQRLSGCIHLSKRASPGYRNGS
jgi:hypothetical protein